MKHLIGIDIGTGAVKLAQISNENVLRTSYALLSGSPVQNGRVVSPEELAKTIRLLHRESKFRGRRCALVLPREVVFVRRLTMPYMTEAHLKLNLPYELRDYIQNDKEQYFYDYAVLSVIPDEEGKPAQLDLLAAAAPCEVIKQYRAVLSMAGLRLVLAIPQALAYRNIIRAHEQSGAAHPEEYCIVDMGYSSIRVHMYRGAAYETSRVLDFDEEVLKALGDDTDTSDPDSPHRELYGRIALEITRSVNFYGFNTPDSNLQDIYFSGDLSQSSPLMEEIRSTLTLNCHPIEDLLPPMSSGKPKARYGAAVGAILQSSGR